MPLPAAIGADPSGEDIVLPDCDGAVMPGCDCVVVSEFIGCWAGICCEADGAVGAEVDGIALSGAVFIPSLVVPVCGMVVPGADVVVSVPLGGVGAGCVWAKAAVPTSRAVAKAIDFIAYTPLRRRGQARCKVVNV